MIALTPAQQGIWFIYKSNPDDISYNMPFGFNITQHLDADKLHAAIQKIVCLQPALHGYFNEDANAEVKFAFNPNPGFEFSVVNLSSSAENLIQAAANEIIARPFDLTKPPLIRCKLIKVNTTQHYCRWLVN
jgi:hypothetical protein